MKKLFLLFMVSIFVFSFESVVLAKQPPCDAVPGVSSEDSMSTYEIPQLMLLSADSELLSTNDEYLKPYILMLEQYAEETGIEVEIANPDLFYKTCMELSLSEWQHELDEMYIRYQSINNESIVLEPNQNRTRDFGSSNGVPGTSSNETLSRSFDFSDAFDSTIRDYYRYYIEVSGTLINYGAEYVFDKVNWLAYEFEGKPYFHVNAFKNKTNTGDSASIDAVGFLMEASGIAQSVQITLHLKIYADWYY